MHTLENRVAVVTGAGSGIGRATAERLAYKGCDLALVDIRAESLEQTAASVTAHGRKASIHVADVSDYDRMMELPDEVLAEHGAVHILMNNAGVMCAGRFEDESLDDIRWMVGINIWGVMYGCKAFLPVLRQAEEAHVVNTASMVGLLGMPYNSTYSLTKGAVRAFSEGLRGELAGTSIGVTAVMPGGFKTNVMAGSRGAEGERLAQLAAHPMANVFLRSPDTAARRIVLAIEKNKPRTVLGVDGHMVDTIARVAPGRSGVVGRFLHKLTG